MNITAACAFREYGCIQDNSTLTCNVVVPKTIPESVTHVYIKGINLEQEELEFKSESWRRVLVLDIETVEGHYFRKRNMPLFSNLTTLTYLGIHVGYFSYLDQELLIGLPFLKSLDLSNCFYLEMEEVNKLFINNNSVPNLKRLYLNYLNVDSNTPITIDTAFIDNLTTRPIKLLSLRGVNAIFKFDSKGFNKLCNSVEELDVSNTVFSYISQTSSENFYPCGSVRVINASGNYYRRGLLIALQGNTGSITVFINLDLSGVPALETVYLNNLDYG